jgi:lipoyl-dependent peroxiredoxin subunit D
MSIESLKAAIPDYAKDIRLNLGSLMQITSLTEQQLHGTLLACAIASRNEMVLSALDEETSSHLSPEAKNAVKSAAAVMAMNNVYYRFTHLVQKPDYQTMPARLRMNVIGNPGVDKADFELWCLAVSAINGCGRCLESHEHEVIEKGISKEGVQDAVRIAAVVHAVAVTLQAEDHFYAATHEM